MTRPVAVDNAYSGLEDGGSVTDQCDLSMMTGSGVDGDAIDGDPLTVTGF